jgi:REP-associated tyrosine transposase
MNDAAYDGNADLPINGAGKPAQEKEGTNQEIGVPGGRGWHGRGYLPHFDSPEVTQHVTFHLADSLAKATLERMEEELRKLPVSRQDVARRKKIEAWIDAGHGSCMLRDPLVAALVQNALLFFDGERYELLAWVIMPNHVHVLFRTVQGWTVAKVVASWKKFTARQICACRRNHGNANLTIGEERESANQEIGVPEKKEPVWHREYWDRFMRDEDHFLQAVEYIHQNPVQAGLVAKAEDWRWSSAHPGNANHRNANLGTPIS